MEDAVPTFTIKQEKDGLSVLRNDYHYHRLNVYDYVLEFCGWDAIDELIKYAGSPRNELYLLSLIKTGGRAGEVLSLARGNFTMNKKSKAIFVEGMKLEKRYRTVKDVLSKKPIVLGDGRRMTERLNVVRKPFPILLSEPLSDLFLDRLNAVGSGALFTSPYKTHGPLTVSWGYKRIRKISAALPPSLFNRLGLNKPFIDKASGAKLDDVIHLWQHWFRSQRASQLRSEYEFSEADLMEYFGWLDYKTALHYSRLGASNLAKKMLKAIT
jgi:integrase